MAIKNSGWYRESYRHSLAAKGVKTSKRLAFVNNAAKGWRSNPNDLKIVNEEGMVVDARKSAAARGIETFNKRRDERAPSFPESLDPKPQAVIPGAPEGFGEELTPTAPLPESSLPLLDAEQQAQQVEGGPPQEVTAPLPISEPEEVKELEDGLVDRPDLATPGAPESPTPLESVREEFKFE